MIHRPKLAEVAAFGFLLLTFEIAVFGTTEADILLTLAALQTPGAAPLRGWNSSNIANLCVDWEGIKCNNGKVSNAYCRDSPDPRTGLPPRLSGRWPAGLANLTSLESLDIFACKLVGNIPSEMFLLPNLRFVNLNGVPVGITFPAVIQSPISALILQGTDLSGRMPEFADWSRLDSIDLAQTRITCELPAGFITAITANRLSPNLECELQKTLLQVDDNNLLCGQIHVSNIPCSVYPFLGGFQRAMGPPLFRTRFNDAVVSATNNIISFFPTYVGRNGSVLDYTAEYLSIRVFPVGVSRPKRLNFASSGFQTFSRAQDGSTLKFNSTLTTLDDPNLLIRSEFVLYSLPPVSGDGARRRFKFSSNFYLLSGSWPVNTTTGAFGVTASYRTAHSPPSGITSCNDQSGFAVLGQCTSPVAEVDFGPEPGLATYRGTVMTKTIELEFSFGLEGSSDGQLLTFENSRIEADILLNPPGFLDVINSFNRFAPLDRASGVEKDQSVIAFVQIEFPIFNRSLLYDPDISLRLLFDPEALAPEQGGEQLATGISVGVIVAIVVTILVVIVGITLFATFVFPYLKQRQSDQGKSLAAEEMDTVDGESERRWTTGTPQERAN